MLRWAPTGCVVGVFHHVSGAVHARGARHGVQDQGLAGRNDLVGTSVGAKGGLAEPTLTGVTPET
jgi:hypothetical protein